MIFMLRDILHVGVALSILFFFNSLIFLAADQPLLAIVQLFVMVGGISTYLIIGVASIPVSKFRHARVSYIVAFGIMIFIAMLYPMLSGMSFSPATPIQLSASALESEMGSHIGVFYVLTLLVFAAGTGSIALFKRIRGRR